MPAEWQRLAAEGIVSEGIALDRLTTYRMGGPARWYAEPSDHADLCRIAAALSVEPVPVLVLGRGSNVVVSDAGFPGLVLHLGAGFAGLRMTDDAVEGGGGLPLARLARGAAREGRLGLEFLVGIPGSVGGAVRQNAGCLGSEVSDWLVDAEIFDLSTGVADRRTPVALELGYRHSAVGPSEIVVSARFRFRPGPVDEGEARLLEVTRWRRTHQPGGTLNAGSVFKNPPGDAAGRIIDQLGLKGFALGRVAVSTKHANFFVAEHGATAAEVHRLVAAVHRQVLERTGIDLEPEVQFVGQFEGDS
ncbi:MAG: UDP-N-acetylmuramate dehydrogenase [Acidimicrobiia bacterium]|jgi:UDP-N-acetylmuramate dehydrogenase